MMIIAIVTNLQQNSKFLLAPIPNNLPDALMRDAIGIGEVV